MAKGIYVGVGSVAKKVKKMYVGVNGVARKVKKVYVGVGGVARLAWSGSGKIVEALGASTTSPYPYRYVRGIPGESIVQTDPISDASYRYINAVLANDGYMYAIIDVGTQRTISRKKVGADTWEIINTSFETLLTYYDYRLTYNDNEDKFTITILQNAADYFNINTSASVHIKYLVVPRSSIASTSFLYTNQSWIPFLSNFSKSSGYAYDLGIGVTTCSNIAWLGFAYYNASNTTYYMRFFKNSGNGAAMSQTTSYPNVATHFVIFNNMYFCINNATGALQGIPYRFTITSTTSSSPSAITRLNATGILDMSTAGTSSGAFFIDGGRLWYIAVSSLGSNPSMALRFKVYYTTDGTTFTLAHTVETTYQNVGNTIRATFAGYDDDFIYYAFSGGYIASNPNNRTNGIVTLDRHNNYETSVTIENTVVNTYYWAAVEN